MKRTVLSGIFSVLLGLESAPAIGASPDNFRIDEAADLAALCGANSEDPLYASAIQMCEGYLIGVHQMHTAIAAALGGGIYCLPAENPPTRDEAAAAFVAYVATNAEITHMKALDALLTWARHAYPCR